MKKNMILLAMVSFLSTSIALTGCKNNSDNTIKVSNSMTGDDIAKILLANERLDADNIVMADILDSGQQRLLKNKKTANKTPKRSVERNGNSFKWNDLTTNYSDSLLSLTTTLESCNETAEKTSELINYIKNEVRVVDTWIDGQYLLHVEKNEDIIFNLDNKRSVLKITRRFINEEGITEYEDYQQNINGDYNFKTISKFIQNQHYEYIHSNETGNYYFVADKSKGYWETFTFSKNSELGQFAIFKDDMSYNSIYTLDFPIISKITATDNPSRDFIDIVDSTFKIQTSGLNGISSMNVDITDESQIGPSADYLVQDDGYGHYTTEEGYITLENGKIININDLFVNGKVKFVRARNVYVPYYKNYGITIELFVEGDTLEDRLNNLELFFKETGISTKTSYEKIKDSISFASSDAHNFLHYYKWDNNSINNDEIYETIKNKDLILNSYYALYEDYKDNPSISSSNKTDLKKVAYFANVTIDNVTSITNEDNATIKINNLELSIDDTTLFTSGNEYRLGFALAKEENGIFKDLIHFENIDIEKTVYDGSDVFAIKGSVDLQLSNIDAGTYKLVSFISNVNGLRLTKPIALQSASISEKTIDSTDVSIEISKDAQNNVVITYTKLVNINLELSNDNYNYETLYEKLALKAYEYGSLIADAKIEKLNNNLWNEVSILDSFANGTYRLKYQSETGVGYVIATIK